MASLLKKRTGGRTNPKQKIDLSDEQKSGIKEAFDLFDSDGSGKIDTKDLKIVLRSLGQEQTKEEIERIITVIDPDGQGHVPFEKFLKLMLTKIEEKHTAEEVLKAFHLFDDDNTGKITFKNLKRVSDELGENLTDEELQEMIEEVDRSGDGKICPDDFLHVMKKTCMY